MQLFAVIDSSSGELMGYFYLDIYSRFILTINLHVFGHFFLGNWHSANTETSVLLIREGKYAHTCVVALQNGSSISCGRLVLREMTSLSFQFKLRLFDFFFL